MYYSFYPKLLFVNTSAYINTVARLHIRCRKEGLPYVEAVGKNIYIVQQLHNLQDCVPWLFQPRIYSVRHRLRSANAFDFILPDTRSEYTTDRIWRCYARLW